MGNFTYQLREADQRVSKGALQAGNLNEALIKARQMGGEVISVKPAGTSWLGRFFGGGRLPFKEKIVLTEQIAVMLKAGITLVQALKGISEESSHKVLQRTLAMIVEDMEGGASFSQALEKHPQVFSRIFVQMVRSAEKTGKIAEVLEKLTTQMEKEHDLRGKVKGALIYPAVISVLLVGVVILVITFILPKLSVMFTESGVPLPASTRMLLWLSDLFVHQWYLMIGLVVISIVGFRTAVRTKQGRLVWDNFIIRFPVIGTMLRKTYLSRFCQNFSSLIEAGVPVLEAFGIVRDVVGNVVYEQAIQSMANDVENGIKISIAIRKNRNFPGMVGQLASVGEQSGDLAGIFNVLANFFEKEVDGMARNLSTLLEPIIMIFMGAGIGFILISVLQPIYGLVNAV